MLESVLNRYLFQEVVIQPGTFCNLACRYCYIPLESRNARRLIDTEVLQLLSRSLQSLAPYLKTPVSLLFHAGEPLTVGVETFQRFLAPFESLRLEGIVRYSLQTNGTLINEEWCDFFRRYQVGVGVSIDGPEEFCTERVSRRGLPVFPKIQSGIQRLREAGIPFGCIAVLASDLFQSHRCMDDLAGRIHCFFSSLGANSVGLNIEECENANITSHRPQETQVYAFWYYLYQRWQHQRTYEIRDLSRAERFALEARAGNRLPFKLSLIPTVDTDGNVYFFSPEIVGTKSPRYGDFIVGNLKERSLEQMIAGIEQVPYVRDFIQGANECQGSCAVFDLCQSRHVLSNKYAEHGDLRSTETGFCRSNYILPVRAVISSWAARASVSITVKGSGESA